MALIMQRAANTRPAVIIDHNNPVVLEAFTVRGAKLDDTLAS
jgi:hypothetical protein